jgi:hypothetical protein
MAFNYPVSLHFPPFRMPLFPNQIARIVESGKTLGRIAPTLVEAGAELVFEPTTCEWIATKEIHETKATAAGLLSKGRWLRLDVEVNLGRGNYFVEFYTFPLKDSPELAGFQVNFDGRAYASIFEFEPRAEGGFDEDSKRDFLAFCLNLSGMLESAGFILLPEDGSFYSVPLDRIDSILRQPSDQNFGVRPGLITAIRESVLPVDAIRSAWKISSGDSRVKVSTRGYCLLDLVNRYQEN